MENSVNNANQFYSSLDTREICTTDTKSDNVEIMMGIETDDLKELFKSLKERYQERLETIMKVTYFAFESVDLLCYSLHKISLNRGGSYIDSRKWFKIKKSNNKSTK